MSMISGKLPYSVSVSVGEKRRTKEKNTGRRMLAKELMDDVNQTITTHESSRETHIVAEENPGYYPRSAAGGRDSERPYLPSREPPRRLPPGRIPSVPYVPPRSPYPHDQPIRQYRGRYDDPNNNNPSKEPPAQRKHCGICDSNQHDPIMCSQAETMTPTQVARKLEYSHTYLRCLNKGHDMSNCRRPSLSCTSCQQRGHHRITCYMRRPLKREQTPRFPKSNYPGEGSERK